MKIKPIGERVLLKTEKREEKTASGIILTANTIDKGPETAEIVAIGNLETFPMLQVGMRVLYDKSLGREIKEEEESYLLINAEDILAVIE